MTATTTTHIKTKITVTASKHITHHIAEAITPAISPTVISPTGPSPPCLSD
jgi:hypothetical protein